MSVEDHGGMTLTWKISQFVHQNSLAILPTESFSSNAWGTSEGNDEFDLTKYIFHALKGYLTCGTMLRHGACGIISPPNEGVLRILIVLKNPSLSAGFEPENLGSNGKHPNQYTTENYKVLSSNENGLKS
jgi:hypothetical protein